MIDSRIIIDELQIDFAVATEAEASEALAGEATEIFARELQALQRRRLATYEDGTSSPSLIHIEKLAIRVTKSQPQPAEIARSLLAAVEDTWRRHA